MHCVAHYLPWGSRSWREGGGWWCRASDSPAAGKTQTNDRRHTTSYDLCQSFSKLGRSAHATEFHVAWGWIANLSKLWGSTALVILSYFGAFLSISLGKGLLQFCHWSPSSFVFSCIFAIRALNDIQLKSCIVTPLERNGFSKSLNLYIYICVVSKFLGLNLQCGRLSGKSALCFESQETN
jgi:hypothetical protein